jgi:metal-responsive CopG/Arc/MetJ family transcriptional regulator
MTQDKKIQVWGGVPEWVAEQIDEERREIAASRSAMVRQLLIEALRARAKQRQITADTI